MNGDNGINNNKKPIDESGADVSNNDAIAGDLQTMFESYPASCCDAAEGMADAVDQTIEVYKNATQAISGNTDVIWNATKIKDTGYTFTNGNAPITLPEGRYRIICKTTIYESGGSNPARSCVWIEENSGGSYVAAVGSHSYAYHPIGEYYTHSIETTIEFSSSYSIKAVAALISGSGALTIYSSGCNLIVKRL